MNNKKQLYLAIVQVEHGKNLLTYSVYLTASSYDGMRGLTTNSKLADAKAALNEILNDSILLLDRTTSEKANEFAKNLAIINNIETKISGTPYKTIPLFQDINEEVQSDYNKVAYVPLTNPNPFLIQELKLKKFDDCRFDDLTLSGFHIIHNDSDPHLYDYIIIQTNQFDILVDYKDMKNVLAYQIESYGKYGINIKMRGYRTKEEAMAAHIPLTAIKDVDFNKVPEQDIENTNRFARNLSIKNCVFAYDKEAVGVFKNEQPIVYLPFESILTSEGKMSGYINFSVLFQENKIPNEVYERLKNKFTDLGHLITAPNSELMRMGNNGLNGHNGIL